MTAMACQITSLSLFTQPFIQAQIKENSKAPRHWPLRGKFTDNKGPLTRKMFPFDDVIMSVYDSKQFNHGDDVNEGDEIGKIYNE